MPRKFCPTNSERSWGPVYRSLMPRASRISLARSAHASKARDSESTSVLSQSKRRVVIGAIFAFWREVLSCWNLDEECSCVVDVSR